MSNWSDFSFIQQGWQCPVCGAVYSPMTMACMNCTGWKVSNIYKTSIGDSVIDLLHRESETKSEKPKEATEPGTSNISDIEGLWCDDITFCQEDCEDMDCPRNKHHIRDRQIPHSYFVDIPPDCPKKEGNANETACT